MGWRSRFRLEVGKPEHFRWLHTIVALVLVLNVADVVLTIVWLETGTAVEANPIMNEFYGISPVAFAACKITLVSIGSYFLWTRRSHPLSVIALFVAFFVYYMIFVYHLQSVT